MAKGNRNKKLKRNINEKYNGYPNVSICTPTFNRRPFFKGLIECIASQDYPHYKIEWIVVDDGTDCVKDIFDDEHTKNKLKDIKVHYFYEKEKMDLGKKRNYMHSKCTYNKPDDIIVYMDDDDFYPSERVSHSVDKLVKNPKALCGGSSEIYLWFNTLDKMYRFGPYGPNHATAGTFSFRRKLLEDTSYEDSAVLAEEKHFLKNYTVPFVQFDPLKTILVFSHEQNTFDKRRLINTSNKFCNESSFKVKQFVKDDSLRNFYTNIIGKLLKEYEDGDVKNKPKVLEEIKRRDQERIQHMENANSGITVHDTATNQSRDLSIKEVRDIITQKTNENNALKKKLQEVYQENQKLKAYIHSHIQKQNTDISSNSIVQPK